MQVGHHRDDRCISEISLGIVSISLIDELIIASLYDKCREKKFRILNSFAFDRNLCGQCKKKHTFPVSVRVLFMTHSPDQSKFRQSNQIIFMIILSYVKCLCTITTYFFIHQFLSAFLVRVFSCLRSDKIDFSPTHHRIRSLP